LVEIGEAWRQFDPGSFELGMQSLVVFVIARLVLSRSLDPEPFAPLRVNSAKGKRRNRRARTSVIARLVLSRKL
jgi:hypothetical protein